jgi:hypothetical protein
MRYFPQRALLTLLAATLLLTAPSGAKANYLDDSAAFDKAISQLRSAIGDHARVLQITAECLRLTVVGRILDGYARPPRSSKTIEAILVAAPNVGPTLATAPAIVAGFSQSTGGRRLGGRRTR